MRDVCMCVGVCVKCARSAAACDNTTWLAMKPQGFHIKERARLRLVYFVPGFVYVYARSH